MANLIILEGTSRTGKTTILRQLCDFYFFHTVFIDDRRPEGYDRRSLYRGFMTGVMSAIDSFPNENFVIDRLFLSELVYSKILGRIPCIELEEIQDFCSRHTVQNWTLLSSYETYLNRNPKEGYTSLEHSQFIKEFEEIGNTIQKSAKFANEIVWIDNDKNSDRILEQIMRKNEYLYSP